MNASEKNKCQSRGAVVPATSTEKLCPACLTSGALEPSGDQIETITVTPVGNGSRRKSPARV